MVGMFLLNQACASLCLVFAWFLEITFMPPKYVCVCVHPQRPYTTSGVILTLNDWLNNCGCFSLPFYSSCRRCHHDRHGPSSKMLHQL